MFIGGEIDQTKTIFSYLDTIELMPYIVEFEGQDIYYLMNKLEEVFPYKDEYSETLFDVISDDEFGDYLNRRYDLYIREVSFIKIRL